jgi:hypothetical protein
LGVHERDLLAVERYRVGTKRRFVHRVRLVQPCYERAALNIPRTG